jgi:hypothetical protein
MKTYEEWNALGRRVHKGSKANGFKDGKPLFSESQTWDHKERGSEMRQDFFNAMKLSAHLGITGQWDDPPH